MDVYVTSDVKQWAKNANVPQVLLHNAAKEVLRGQYDADHGSGLYKKRIAAISGRGKSGGARTLLAWNKGDRVVFLFGFKKSQRDSVPKSALKPYRNLAKLLNDFCKEDIELAVKEGELHKLIEK